MRTAEINRKTNETDIVLKLNLDGEGRSELDCGCGFLEHMLDLFAAHGGFDLCVKCVGDTNVDYHHSVEDIGIALGQSLKAALSDGRGIARYGSFFLPMDESLVLVALDISGRSYLVYDVNIPTEKVGDFDTELVKEFLLALCREAGLTLHVKMLSGENSHHIIEAIFKGLGHALCAAVKENGDKLLSTKGKLL